MFNGTVFNSNVVLTSGILTSRYYIFHLPITLQQTQSVVQHWKFSATIA